MRRKQAQSDLTRDIFFILIGAGVTYFLSQEGIIDGLIYLFGNGALASFVAGIFFTSIFTIAPASVTLIRIAENTPVGTVAIWGALGAMCGDLFLFFYIRDRFTDDLIHSMRPSAMKHILSSFHLGFMKWLSPVLGALLIASPLPDEFGLALLGISRIRAAVLMPIAFAMNMLGIYSIVWFGSVV